jgi:hypothetical protein
MTTKEEPSKEEAALRRKARKLQNSQLVLNLLTCNTNIASGAAGEGEYLRQEMNNAIVYRQEYWLVWSGSPKPQIAPLLVINR